MIPNQTIVLARAGLARYRVFVFALLVKAFLFGCATSGGEPSNMQRCAEPRSPVCTREYRPVCGQQKDGSWRTYGNACDACADPNVSRHRPGPCRP